MEGRPLAYDMRGQGPAVLLLHAFPLHSGMWEPQLRPLSARHTVVRLDAQTGEQVGEPIAVPGRPVSVSIAEGYVWVTSNEAGTLTRIQP